MQNTPARSLKCGTCVRVLHHLGQGRLKYWAWVAWAKTPVEVKQQDLKHGTASLTYNRFNLLL